MKGNGAGNIGNSITSNQRQEARNRQSGLMNDQKSTIAPGKARGPFILGIDIGTSAVKILLYDRQGRAVEQVRSHTAVKIRTSRTGASEADPDGLLEIVWQGLDSVLAKAGKLAEEIAAVASCTFVGNIMAIDKKGKRLTPVFTYADSRAEKDVGWLQAYIVETSH